MLHAPSFQWFPVNFIKKGMLRYKFSYPSHNPRSLCLYFVKFLLLIVCAVVPDNISIFQYWCYEGKINSFKGFSTKTKLQPSHGIHSTPSFFLDIIDMLMTSTIIGKINLDVYESLLLY